MFISFVEVFWLRFMVGMWFAGLFAGRVSVVFVLGMLVILGLMFSWDWLDFSCFKVPFVWVGLCFLLFYG